MATQKRKYKKDPSEGFTIIIENEPSAEVVNAARLFAYEYLKRRMEDEKEKAVS